MSAFGTLRTLAAGSRRLCPTRVTQSGHRATENPAVQLPSGASCAIVYGGRQRPPPRFGTSQGIDMLRQLVVGSGVSICNIVIHALVMSAVVRVARTVGAKKTTHPTVLLIFVMVATVSVLMAAHMSEVLVWALAYAIV